MLARIIREEFRALEKKDLNKIKKYNYSRWVNDYPQMELLEEEYNFSPVYSTENFSHPGQVKEIEGFMFMNRQEKQKNYLKNNLKNQHNSPSKSTNTNSISSNSEFNNKYGVNSEAEISEKKGANYKYLKQLSSKHSLNKINDDLIAYLNKKTINSNNNNLANVCNCPSNSEFKICLKLCK